MSDVLELRDLGRTFGSLAAVAEVSLTVPAGSRHAVIGPNGAGKSTLFGLVAGAIRATSGSVVFEGSDVTALPEHARVRAGITRTFQHSSLFLGATVLENVLLPLQRAAGRSRRLFGNAGSQGDLTEQAMAHLRDAGLQDRSAALAGALSHGERRQLEVAVALATGPRLLLLDEPAAGMSPAETARLTEFLGRLPGELTVMLIEHDLDVVFGVADTVTVLHLGRHLLTGTPEDIRSSPEVQSAYLGGADTSELFPGVAT